ncbi:MAG: DUF481 domain-containing protein [Acidobacteriota bacterium]
MKRFTFVVLYLALSGALGVAVRADQLVMKNGDRLSGVIIRADGATLIIKSEYAGELTVKTDAISEITSDQPLHLTLKDGRTLVGKVRVRDDKVDLGTEAGARESVDRRAVTIIRSASEQKAYEHSLHPGWREFWNGYVDFGYSLTTGNIDTSTTTLGANFGRETRRDKTTVYAALIKAKNKTNGTTTTTANAIRGGGRYEINLNRRLFGFGFADFEHNEIQLLDLRSVFGGGLGYSLIKNDRTDLQAFGGGAFNHERFATGRTRNAGEILAGQSLSHRLSDRLTLKERFQIFPNLTDTGAYRMTRDAGVSAKVLSFLDWQLTVSDRYQSNPVAGAKSNDLLLTTGLRFNIRR